MQTAPADALNLAFNWQALRSHGRDQPRNFVHRASKAVCTTPP